MKRRHPRARVLVTIGILLVWLAPRLDHAGAQSPGPNCPVPRPPDAGSCNIFAMATVPGQEFSTGIVQAGAFTPDSPVRFEVFESPGGPTIFGPVTKLTDAGGNQVVNSADGLVLEPGNFVVATDIATTTVKELEVAALTVDFVDIVADTVSGTAPPNADVVAQIQRPDLGQPQTGATANITADASGSWSADFGQQGVDITENYFTAGANVIDEDGDTTGAFPDPGCPPIRKGARYFCAISVGVDGDWLGGGFTPNSTVEIEVFDASGGESIFGPVTRTTDVTGAITFIFVGFEQGTDFEPGMSIVMTDAATATVKVLEVMPIVIDRVDPVTDVVEGRAPPGEVVSLDLRVTPEEVEASQSSVPAGKELVADSEGNWRADYSGSFDITFDDSFNASAFDIDGDITEDELGAPLPDCTADVDTTCGSAGDDMIREDDGEVISGGGEDTTLIGTDDDNDVVDVELGDDDDMAVISPEKRHRLTSLTRGAVVSPLIVLHGGAGKERIVVPIDARSLVVRIFGGTGADVVELRDFGGPDRMTTGSYLLVGGGGNDKLTAGDGDDILEGGGGTDILRGGPGFDICYATGADQTFSCEKVVHKRHR